MVDPGLTVGVIAESAGTESAGTERRVALTPDGVTRLVAAGLAVAVESGAGQAAWYPDAAYRTAGARMVDRAQVYAVADMLVCLHPPADVGKLHAGQTLVGLLRPLTDPRLAERLAAAGVTAISLDMLPRTVSRAQAMDALTSQANVAGYKAVLVAADAYGGYLPMLMTAAGTIRPAQVLVLGAGVAGLQAIATARRLGALVTGYDVREAARAEIASTGAAVLDLPATAAATGPGGYARELTADETRAQQDAMDAAVGRFDIVITTAQVPGVRPPRLVCATALARMRPGSVVVDLAAGPLGGNVDGSVADATVVTERGVTVVGAPNLPSAVPRAASTSYSRNVTALLTYLVRDGALVLDRDDEIQAGVLITYDGRIVHPRVAETLTPSLRKVGS